LFVCNTTLGIVQVEPSGEFSIFAARIGDRKLICPNFGVFDSAGNYFVTDSGHWKKHNGPPAPLHAGRARQIIEGSVGYTNGLALSADERLLYVVESDTDSVYRFELGADGAVVKRELYVFAGGALSRRPGA